MTETIPVTVISGEEETTIEVDRGETLRDALLEHGFPVYGTVSQYANCGGQRCDEVVLDKFTDALTNARTTRLNAFV